MIVFTSSGKIVSLSIFLEKAIKSQKYSSPHTERRRKLRFEHNMWEHISKLYFEQFFYFLISFFTKNLFLTFIKP